MERGTASARTPSFSHLKNTHPGCFGVPEVSRSTFRVQSSHSMSGIGKPQDAARAPSPVDGRMNPCPQTFGDGGRTKQYLHAAMRLSLGYGRGSQPLHRLGQQPAARDDVPQICKIRRPADAGGKGGEASCPWRPSAMLLPAAFAGILGGGAREERRGGWWKKARDEMSPVTNRFRLYVGHRSREGETCVFPGWARGFAAPPKNFCGSGRDAGSNRAGFSAPTRILAVILRVGAGCGVC